MKSNPACLKTTYHNTDGSDGVDEVVELANAIAEKITGSQTYKDYQKALAKLKNNPETMDKVKQLKTKHLEYAAERMRGVEDFNKEKYISQEFYKVMLNEDVKVYFMNEEKLVSTITEIYYKVAEKCQLNLFV